MPYYLYILRNRLPELAQGRYDLNARFDRTRLYLPACVCSERSDSLYIVLYMTDYLPPCLSAYTTCKGSDSSNVLSTGGSQKRLKKTQKKKTDQKQQLPPHRRNAWFKAVLFYFNSVAPPRPLSFSPPRLSTSGSRHCGTVS